ncbi:hypothetical protein A8L34_04395 [Bacillus sp. FJAT-27264]|uniref:hypothetical protein n=1 Tax=Paenibacillus sp. (strain DSM 101736 / FJAT-27264) TaxID=1850362 RepID=UPI000807E535|nr:hypothetical protein [Bacillus sp. FJAT-27264]OBZ18804.1 hypothetical protein A8L34_04395 [Bacillus sp. FJAT-27264]
MNTSSFLCGVLLGAAASMIISKKRSALMSSLVQSGANGHGAGDRAKEKLFSMAMTGFGNTSASGDQDQGHEPDSKSGKGEHKKSEKSESPVQSKESNLKMLKEFISSNPDVKHEVEKILKDTHSAIPGL